LTPSRRRNTALLPETNRFDAFRPQTADHSLCSVVRWLFNFPATSPVATPAEVRPEPEAPPPTVATTPAPETKPAPAPEIRPQPPTPPKPPPLEPAAAAVVARLAAQLRISIEQIEITQVSRAEWPDSCLGLAADGEICSSVIMPGFAVSLRVDEQRYEFRSDESGRRIRVAAAPPAETGEPLLNWRDSQSFTALIIGSDRTAYGLRGRPLLGLPPPLTDRIDQLVAFIGKYASFQARTAAGEVGFRGMGTTIASATEQRMIAEWAALVAPEVGQGMSATTPDLALVWQRTGGVAGFCDRVIVGRTGFASAWSCRGGEEKLIATTALESSELAELYEWLDQFEAFSWTSDDLEAAADGMSLSLEFDSTGLNPVGEAERQRMLALIESLVGRLLAASGVNRADESP